ncbi:hypothetical protein [uncultured Microbulbifer sp.]|uniref:hypothetical protein n=1 Tax=uncultured Microbulbifer sp. TaxID=348147 RepID=UPI0025D1B56A|nr:hypothetical protein [uncultured Microbulbifer sp.]
MYARQAMERLGSVSVTIEKLALRLAVTVIACLVSTTAALAGNNVDDSADDKAMPVSEAPRVAGRNSGDEDFQKVYERIDDSDVARQFEHAEWVAQVKITGVHRMVDNALSEPGMVAILGYVYSGVAQKVWKGEQGELVAFRITLDACDRKLVRGEQYLLFAETDTDGRLQIASCQGVMAGADAASLLAYLQPESQG